MENCLFPCRSIVILNWLVLSKRCTAVSYFSEVFAGSQGPGFIPLQLPHCCLSSILHPVTEKGICELSVQFFSYEISRLTEPSFHSILFYTWIVGLHPAVSQGSSSCDCAQVKFLAVLRKNRCGAGDRTRINHV